MAETKSKRFAGTKSRSLGDAGSWRAIAQAVKNSQLTGVVFCLGAIPLAAVGP